MKQYLLPEQGQFYKANLHCHSTVSDGRLTPQELKELYMRHGYSIIAYTDHEVMIPHQELTDDTFLALHAHELSFSNGMKGKDCRVCHLCMIGLEPDNVRQVCWHRSKYICGNAKNYMDQVTFDESAPDYERVYSVEGINEVIDIARKAGFFVTYNHPVWSLEDPEQYMKYKGFHAMEIYNHGCVVEGYDDYVPQIFDAMLRKGNRIFCVATDDNHNRHAEGSPFFDSLGGFTMIKADRLDYRSVTRAMEAGHFYASTGPLIHELWYEDGSVHIKCSPAAKIVANYGMIRAKVVYAEGTPLTEASFPVKPDSLYFRLTVTDEKGGVAHTNAYFIDDLPKEQA
ncbi:MAG: PHP domain-containing protein [Clostridia bacterium]|nr:PHP domain-containing protein [Clostridia bacterium]